MHQVFSPSPVKQRNLGDKHRYSSMSLDMIDIMYYVYIYIYIFKLNTFKYSIHRILFPYSYFLLWCYLSLPCLCFFALWPLVTMTEPNLPLAWSGTDRSRLPAQCAKGSGSVAVSRMGPCGPCLQFPTVFT